jgi:hypothetical protein
MNRNTKLSKIVLIRYREYKWINNVLKLAKRSSYIKKCVMNEKLSLRCESILKSKSIIKKDKHKKGSLSYSINMARYVLKEKAEIRECKQGSRFIE